MVRDPNREFAPLMVALRRAMPNLLTLGDHDPAQRQGPAIWVRAALGRAIPGITWEADAPAILYLPGVARETLRTAEDCPQHLRLLAWFVVGDAYDNAMCESFFATLECELLRA